MINVDLCLITTYKRRFVKNVNQKKKNILKKCILAKKEQKLKWEIGVALILINFVRSFTLVSDIQFRIVRATY